MGYDRRLAVLGSTIVSVDLASYKPTKNALSFLVVTTSYPGSFERAAADPDLVSRRTVTRDVSDRRLATSNTIGRAIYARVATRNTANRFPESQDCVTKGHISTTCFLLDFDGAAAKASPASDFSATFGKS